MAYLAWLAGGGGTIVSMDTNKARKGCGREEGREGGRKKRVQRA